MILRIVQDVLGEQRLPGLMQIVLANLANPNEGGMSRDVGARPTAMASLTGPGNA